MSNSNDPFALYRNPVRIETLNASANFKLPGSSTFNTSPRCNVEKFKPHLSIQTPYDPHPHSYKHGSLPMFLPNRHTRQFRKKRSPKPPPSTTTNVCLSRTDTMREARGRRSRKRQQQQHHHRRLKQPRSNTPLCTINLQTRPGKVGWYNSLPETTDQAISHRTKVLHTNPYRPRSSLQPSRKSTEIDATTRLNRSTLLTLAPDLDNSTTARRYRSSVGAGDMTAAITPRPDSAAHTARPRNHNVVMVPGILRITPSTIILDHAERNKTFTLRLPIKNNSNACLAHIDPENIVMQKTNCFAELISHPTLLAPKMVALFVVEICGIGGSGKVVLSFMGTELCTIVVHGES